MPFIFLDDMLERHPAQLDALTRAIVETGEENGECTYIFYDDDDNVSEECDVDREAATQLLAGNLSEVCTVLFLGFD